MTIRNDSPPSRPLAGRVAVVTGAARGIGRAAAAARRPVTLNLSLPDQPPGATPWLMSLT